MLWEYRNCRFRYFILKTLEIYSWSCKILCHWRCQSPMAAAVHIMVFYIVSFNIKPQVQRKLSNSWIHRCYFIVGLTSSLLYFRSTPVKRRWTASSSLLLTAPRSPAHTELQERDSGVSVYKEDTRVKVPQRLSPVNWRRLRTSGGKRLWTGILSLDGSLFHTCWYEMSLNALSRIMCL